MSLTVDPGRSIPLVQYAVVPAYAYSVRMWTPIIQYASVPAYAWPLLSMPQYLRTHRRWYRAVVLVGRHA
eukprot:517044-Rhodomonas_salina.1